MRHELMTSNLSKCTLLAVKWIKIRLDDEGLPLITGKAQTSLLVPRPCVAVVDEAPPVQLQRPRISLLFNVRGN